MSWRPRRRRLVLALALLIGGFGFAAPCAMAEQRTPAGRGVIAWHVTIPPSWFDPSTRSVERQQGDRARNCDMSIPGRSRTTPTTPATCNRTLPMMNSSPPTFEKWA
jgi:hypothetical protein